MRNGATTVRAITPAKGFPCSFGFVPRSVYDIGLYKTYLFLCTIGQANSHPRLPYVRVGIKLTRT